MRQIAILAILLTITGSCDDPSNKINSARPKQTSSEFEKYISTLDEIPLPLKTNPIGKLPKISINFDKNAFKKYKHTWTSQPLGIYYQNEKTIGIIDCSIGDWGLVPFLTTYDLMGNKIDSTGFYKKSGQNIGYEGIEYLTFKTNGIITVHDTIKRWDINEHETDIIEGSMKMTTGKVEYRVLENGQIEEN